MNLNFLDQTLNASPRESRRAETVPEAMLQRAKQISALSSNFHFSGGLYSTVAVNSLQKITSLELYHLKIKNCLWFDLKSARKYSEQNGLSFHEIESDDPISATENESEHPICIQWYEHRQKNLPFGITGLGVPKLVLTEKNEIEVALPAELQLALTSCPEVCFFWDRSLLRALFQNEMTQEFLDFLRKFRVGDFRYWNYLQFQRWIEIQLPDYGFSGTENLKHSSRSLGYRIGLKDWNELLH